MDDVRPSMVLRNTSSTNVVSRNENMQQGGVNTSSEPMKVEKIYLGGGGCGASNLVTTVLKGEQDAMFQR